MNVLIAWVGRHDLNAAAADAALKSVRESCDGTCNITYHLSPGTPTMTAVWFLLGSTTFPGRFIQTSRENGIEDVELPFDIAADFLHDLLRKTDDLQLDGKAEKVPATVNNGA